MDISCDCEHLNNDFDEVTVGPSTNADREAQCIICMELISKDDFTFTHSACSHSGHRQCLLPWINGQQAEEMQTCPMCRQPYEFMKVLNDFHSCHTDCLALTASRMLTTAMTYCTDLINGPGIPHEALPIPTKMSISLELMYWFAHNMLDLTNDVIYTWINVLKQQAIEMLASGQSIQQAIGWIVLKSPEILEDIYTKIHIRPHEIDEQNMEALVEAIEYYNESIATGIDTQICQTWFESAFRVIMLRFETCYYRRLETIFDTMRQPPIGNGSDDADTEFTDDNRITELTDDDDSDGWETTDGEAVTPMDREPPSLIVVPGLPEDEMN